MTRRHIHYEAAFEDYLRSQGIPYIAVDEQRQVIFAGSRVKSFDFLVYRDLRRRWIVDVKGRQYPYVTRTSRRYWENWITRADLDGLANWQEVFGEGFEAMLVFAYWLTQDDERVPPVYIHCCGDRRYAFLCVPLAEYRRHCRIRSRRWGTVTLPVATFRQVARPIQRL